MAGSSIGNIGGWQQAQAKRIVKKFDNLASHMVRSNDGKNDLAPDNADVVKLESARQLTDIADTESLMQAFKKSDAEPSERLQLLGSQLKNLSKYGAAALKNGMMMGFAGLSGSVNFGFAAVTKSELEGTVGKDGSVDKMTAKEVVAELGRSRKEELSLTTLDNGSKQYSISTTNTTFAGVTKVYETVTVKEGKGGVLVYDYDQKFESDTIHDRLRKMRQSKQNAAKPKVSVDG